MGLTARLRLALDGAVTLAALPDRLVEAHGHRTLIITDPLSSGTTGLDAHDIRRHVDAAAVHIAALGTVGDRVVVALPNGWDFFVACLAVIRAGRVAVPVNDKMTARELAHVQSDSGAKVVLRELPSGPASGGRPAEPVPSRQDVAAIFYTSGTTGLPKGAELTHAGLLGGVQRLAANPLTFRNDEIVFALPVAHIMGFSTLLSQLCAGIRVVVLPRFDATAVLDVIERRHSSGFIGVPAMYRMLEEAGAGERNLRSIRVWMSGADAMPPELARTFQRYGASAALPVVGTHVGEALFVEGYGMVELSGGVATKIVPPYAGSLLSRPVAMPLPGHELRVIGDDGRQVRVGQVGELCVKGPGVLRRYHDNEAATSATVTPDGWLRTGDLARRRPLGAVELTGRAKDVIKAGGYSVFAAEVQAVLEVDPSVAEAAVVGLPDDRKGEVVAAVIRPVPGATIDEAALRRRAEAGLAPYKRPVRYSVVDELPRTGTGKVRRDAAKALFDGPGDQRNASG